MGFYLKCLNFKTKSNINIYLPLHLYPCLIMPQSCKKRQRTVRESEIWKDNKALEKEVLGSFMTGRAQTGCHCSSHFSCQREEPSPSPLQLWSFASLLFLRAKWELEWETTVVYLFDFVMMHSEQDLQGR